MAITYSSSGSGGNGTTSGAPGYPASLAAGDWILLLVVTKYPPNAPSTPAGFTLIGQASGGAGAAGADSGSVYMTAYFRISDGTETGTIAVPNASGNALQSRMFRYTKASTDAWTLIGPSVGAFNAATASWSVTGDATLDVRAGDVIVAASGANTDLYTWSAESVAITGVTIGTQTERSDTATPSGDDVCMVFSDHVVSSGTQSSVPTYTMTASGSSAGVNPAGATILFALRAAPIVGTCAFTLDAMSVTSAAVAPAAAACAFTLGSLTISSTGSVADPSAAVSSLSGVRVGIGIGT